MSNNTGIKVILNGINGSQKTMIQTFDMVVDNDKSSIDFNIIFKKVAEKYERMQLQLDVTGQTLMFRARFLTADVQEV